MLIEELLFLSADSTRQQRLYETSGLDGPLGPGKSRARKTDPPKSLQARFGDPSGSSRYSSLSATIGSIPAARRAGIQLDRNAIAMIVTAIDENTSGSLGLTW